MPRILALALILTACADAPSSQQTSAQRAELRTINTTPPKPAPLEQPPMLSDEAPPPKPKPLHQWDTPEPIVFSPEDEKLRASLPFSPAIAMDPIDGGKISIRATTPMFEYKGKIYYFSSEANRRTFMSNPELALKGGFMKL